MPSFFIRTYGCQMNERDSEALTCLLGATGYTLVDSEDDADVILFNTCSVRDQAERKVLGKVGSLKKLKKKRPEVVIGVIGCMAQNYGRDLLDQLPHVDLVVGTDQLHEIPDLLEEVRRGTHGLVATQTGDSVLGALRGHQGGQVSAHVAVMRGCDQFCSYCIVPFTRGREKSRPIEEVVREVTQLVAQGTKEVFLLGQNVTAYGLAEARREEGYERTASPFADLLRAVHEVPGLARIRFLSPHVKFMNDAFIDAICELPKVCKSFHVPVQSGSDRILALMRRGYTLVDYLDRIQRIRDRLSEVTFSTDIIVGFPSETEEDFRATRQLMAEVGFDMAYIFRYSIRSGTKAAKELDDDVPEEEKMVRNKLLLADLAAGAKQLNHKFVGETVEILVQGPSKRNAERWAGRTGTNKVCIFTPSQEVKAGDLLSLRIERTTSHSLFGEPVQ